MTEFVRQQRAISAEYWLKRGYANPREWRRAVVHALYEMARGLAAVSL